MRLDGEPDHDVNAPVQREAVAELPTPDGQMLAEAEAVFRAVTLQGDFRRFLAVPAYTAHLVEQAANIAAWA